MSSDASRPDGAVTYEVAGAGGAAPAQPRAWQGWVDDSCRALAAAGQWRQPRTFDAAGPTGVLACGGSEMVSFASNDYLGLSVHPAVVAAAHGALDRWGAGSGASRLVTGSRPVHAALETALADWKQCQRAVLFPTGFAANLAVLSVFGAIGAHVFSDEWNHASIIDGCRMARAGVSVYPHRDVRALRSMVARASGRPMIVSDAVFSMDGDEADVEALVETAARYQALLVLDEAHGVLGPELPSDHGIDVLRVGTLSKALGSLGGFVAGPERFVALIENRARSYIFTTAPAPADCAAALAALDVVRSEEGEELCSRLATYVGRVCRSLGRSDHRSPIVPVVIGEERTAVQASEWLATEGLWVPAIRPPTVPAGTSRLRVTLSAAHTDAQVNRLVEALTTLTLEGWSTPQGGAVAS